MSASPFTLDAVLGLLALPAAVFVFVYPPLIARLHPGLVSPYPKAELSTRAYAGAIDGSLAASCVFLYQRLDSLPFLIIAVLYLLLRDSMRGQSVGKFLFGLVVIETDTGRPASFSASLTRNILFVVPGINIAAVPLEVRTMWTDPQGQRLGDRLAQTQVVDGFGAKDLVDALLRWWETMAPELWRARRDRRRFS
jgi:uncharacterized RDD family membrane protein YckC